MTNIKNIALLTSGGDAPGMNAVIRAVTRKAIHEGLNVFGVSRGYEGLLLGEIEPLLRRDVGGIINKGGTTLKTARCEAFIEKENQEKALDNLKKLNIEALVVIGGDGSMRGAKALSKLGLPTVTIPATIDNDMCGTQYTIGFDTALNTILEAVSKVRDTTSSHERAAVVEVMGRSAGHLALQAGLACGAEVVLLPEHPMPLMEMCERLYTTHKNGKTHSIVIVAEGAYSGYEVAEYIKEKTYFQPSVTVLGYQQRGGSPSARDTIMAARMGEEAIDALVASREGALIGYVDGQIVITDYEEAESQVFKVDEEVYELIHVLGS